MNHSRTQGKKTMCVFRVVATIIVASSSALLLAGCAGSFSGKSGAPDLLPGAALQGKVMGGRQPIAGAALHLYAAGIAGYAGTNADLLNSAVTTDANGNFNITGKYSCTAGQQIYLVSLGGNPGAGTNPQAGLMAALGDCANLSSSTFINMNEVTTVASAFALSPFMSGYANVGSSATNTLGLKQAFTSANKLVNVASGLAGGPALARGATAPVPTIYSLANILAACVNSTGGASGDGTVCGRLFAYATPGGGATPTDTIGLALAIAKNPGLNVAQIAAYDSPISPYSPRLSATPNDWTLAVTYTAGSMSQPKSVTQDAMGNVWVVNAGANTVTVLSSSGTPVSGSPFTGNGLNAPAAVAMDANGNAWVANKGANTVSGFSAPGTAVGLYTAGTAPSSLAFDAAGNLFVANSGTNSVSVLNNSGTLTQTISTGAGSPSAIAINPR